jgi:hypothetical protein
MVNSTPIYTQSFTGEESFIQYQTLNDNVKHTSPFIYTSFENASNMSPNVCGNYVILPKGTATYGEFKVKIPLKIPINNFLCMRNLKYLMSWMGKWEIRLYFSERNLIYLPIRPLVLDATYAIGGKLVNHADVKYDHFTQWGTPLPFPTVIGTVTATAAGPITFSLTKMTLNDVNMNSAQFQIRMDVMELLKQKYLSEKPLTFPVTTFQIARFTGPPNVNAMGQAPGNTDTTLSIVLCQAINNCDTLFILPFNTANMHTCCYQPYVHSLQLHAGEYGSYPAQPFDTYWNGDMPNIRFVNSIADGLNVNASDLVSFSRDVSAQYVPSPVWASTPAGTVWVTTAYKGPNGVLRDNSNFFIAFPFSTDDDFQGGLSSPASNINFKLTGTIRPPVDLAMQTPWVAAFLIDGVIMIRPDPGSDAAKVIWSDRTVA